MAVLDTNFIIDLMRADRGAVEKLQSLLEGTTPLAVSAMTIMELHHGIARVRQPAGEREKVRRALRGIATYELTHDIAARAGELDGELARKGQTLQPADVIIGVTALHHGDAVVTRNLSDFRRIPGLQVQSY